MRNKAIIVRTSFKGTHNWPEASQFAGPEVDFLEAPHRHTFHIQAELTVLDSDREVEFFVFQKEIDDTIEELYRSNYPKKEMVYSLGRKSCETIAEEIIDSLRTKNYSSPITIEVWEDLEVGARIEDK